MSRYAFTVDVSGCTGCLACQIACKDRAGLPTGLDLLRVEVTETGRYPTPTVTCRVVHCLHCAEPACVPVCPPGALQQGAYGLVALDADACIGCGDCIAACPFDAIVALPDGKVAKCDGCADEVALGWAPTCVRACPMRALGFGPVD